jgi:putative ABC transport system permease protein
VWRLVISSLRAHARRLISTSVAVGLGVALLAGTMVLGDTLRANFDELFQSSLGNADAVVRSANTLDTDSEFAQDLIDGAIAGELTQLDGVAAVAPQIIGLGQLTDAAGEKLGGEGPPTLAGNWIDDPELNPYELVEGRAPQAPNEVVINRGAAEDGDLSVGDTTMVATPEPVEVTIVGIATFGGEDGLGPTTFTGFSLAGAEQHITGRPGEVTSLLVRGEPGTDEDELTDRVAAIAPDGIEVISGDDLVAEANDAIDEDFLGFLRTFLMIFAGVALLVATFSINNTFAIIAAQRQQSSALLRAIGANRRQLLLSLVGEALLVGIIASVVGLAAGLGLAQGLKGLFDAFGFALPAGGMTLRVTTLVIAPLVGLLVTLFASLAPAVRASRVSPLAALRDVAVDRAGASVTRAVIGGLMTVGGVVALVAGAAGDSGRALATAGLGAVLTAGGVVALGPIAARPAAAVIGTPIAWSRGIPGALARRNAVRTPRRTAATASALMIGIGVVAVFTVFAGSLKASVDDNVGAVVHGDLVVAGSQFGGGGLSPGMVSAIDAAPEVDHAVGVGVGPVSIDGRTRQVTILDPAASAGVLVPEPVEGTVAKLDSGQIAVGEALAEDKGWTIGTSLPVRFTDGLTEQLEVGAIYEPSTTLEELIVPTATWDAHQVQTVDNLVVIALADGVDMERGRAAVEEAAADFAPPDVQTTQEFIDEATANVDQILGLIYVMLGLAIVIALMGIANTLSLSIHERVRELGLFRAVGAGRAQVRSMVGWESVVIALFGTAGGLGLGLLLGWGLVQAADRGEFPITFSAPVSQLVVIIIIGALAGIAAAWRPARRAARVDIIGAIATTG